MFWTLILIIGIVALIIGIVIHIIRKKKRISVEEFPLYEGLFEWGGSLLICSGYIGIHGQEYYAYMSVTLTLTGVSLALLLRLMQNNKKEDTENE